MEVITVEEENIYIKNLKHDFTRFSLFFEQATAEANNVIIQNDCVNFYVDSMQKALDLTESYLNEVEFNSFHENTKDKAMKQVTSSSS